MTKLEFLTQLKKKLPGLPQDDVDERLAFYGEMIDDRIEDGLSEEEAVSEAGNIDDIVSGIVAEIPLSKLVKEKIKPRKALRAWEIVLLILGSPIWLSLAVTLFAVMFAVYVSVWAVIVSLWAVFGASGAGALAGVALGVIYLCGGNAITGVATAGAGIFLAGLAILMFFGCKSAVRGTLMLTKKTLILVKNCFIKKEDAQ